MRLSGHAFYAGRTTDSSRPLRNDQSLGPITRNHRPCDSIALAISQPNHVQTGATMHSTFRVSQVLTLG